MVTVPPTTQGSANQVTVLDVLVLCGIPSVPLLATQENWSELLSASCAITRKVTAPCAPTWEAD